MNANKIALRVLAGIFGIALLWVGCSPQDADAAGSCDGSSWCDAGGALSATPRVVLSPRRVVTWSNLASCRFEDGSGSDLPCSWNFPPGGGHDGLSYYFTANGRVHYVWPYGVGRDRGWSWVRSGQADALAESNARRATTRDWGSCRIRRGVVKCANGYRWTW